MTSKMKPFSVFVPIHRLDEEERIVEGLAFANEVVPGEGGIRLKRSAMEAATADYLANGTVRAMHQPIAAGKPLSVEWTPAGAYLRAKVVDDAEWKKVREGVYRGFSIGVIPQVMRGKDVEVCKWWDSSLVDVGKDKDARFECWRVEGVDSDLEVEVCVLGEGDSFVLARDLVARLPELDSGVGDGESVVPHASRVRLVLDEGESDSFDRRAGSPPCPPHLHDRSRESEGGEPDSVSAETITRPRDACGTTGGSVSRETDTGSRDGCVTRETDLISRLQEQEKTISTLTLERAEYNNELARVHGLLNAERARAEAAEGRVEELKRQPVRPAPVRSAFDAQRTFRSLGAADVDMRRADEIRRELGRLTAMPSTSDSREASLRILELQRLKRELQEIEGV